MRLRDIILSAASLATAAAAQQRVVAHTASVAELATPGTNMDNLTETITNAPSPALKTAVPDKPALEASMMGLIVFSAAGLVLL